MTPLFEDQTHWKYLACNLLNYLTPDRIPKIIQRQETDYAYQDDQPTKDIPYISEVCLQHCAETNAATNSYEVVVKLWYPFYPNTVRTKAAGDNYDDGFGLRVAVCLNNYSIDACDPYLTANDWWDNTTAYSSPFSFTTNIGSMSYYNYDGKHPQFLCYTSPVANRITFGSTNPISAANGVYFEAQVVKAQGNTPYNSAGESNQQIYIVNQAMCRSRADGQDQCKSQR